MATYDELIRNIGDPASDLLHQVSPESTPSVPSDVTREGVMSAFPIGDLEQSSTDRFKGVKGDMDRYDYLYFHPDESQLHNEQDRLNLEAYATFFELMGRRPDPTEWAAILPAWQGPDGAINGPAFTVAWKDQFESTPDYYRSISGQYSGDVERIVSDLLGRVPTQEELTYYGSQLASGVDPFDLRERVKQTDEFRKVQDKEFRSELSEELDPYLQENVEKAQEGIISRFAKAGRTQSPSLDLAITEMIGDIQKEREKYLAGTSFQQYQGNKSLAREDYLNNLNQYLQSRGFDQNRNLGIQDLYMGRGLGNLDFSKQEAAYSRLANAGAAQDGKFPWGQTIGTVTGATIGGIKGGPAGASAGANIGGGIGSIPDYYWFNS